MADGTFEIKPGNEDIHTANERRLSELMGPVRGKLHTGRSRNDQVATETCLWLVDAERDILNDLANLLSAGAEYFTEHVDILMAGYTHLQLAQPIHFSHWLLSHLLPIMRDTERLKEIIPHANQCPLGSGALAGNAFGVATDLADCLVRKGVLFRETHHISGACVRLAEEQKVSIDTLTLEQLQEIDSHFEVVCFREIIECSTTVR